MKIYLVGGAVRDRLLGRTVTATGAAGAGDRDWVVVGGTPEAMIDAGFRPVGQDFPVFLHPDTGEEHALARTERKSGHGYHGFTFHTSPDVTLEDDLVRRDLTVNAMAEDADGTVIDPWGGQRGLQPRAHVHHHHQVHAGVHFGVVFGALRHAPQAVNLRQQPGQGTASTQHLEHP